MANNNIFFLFVEFDGPNGRRSHTWGFTSAAERAEAASSVEPFDGDEWFDTAEWEAPRSAWPNVQIIR